MKILLFGKSGQVGWELQRSLAPLGEIIALDADSTQMCGDFTNLEGLAATVRAVSPDVIVNAAAHTAVDKAESEPDLVRTINALAPGVLAQEAKRMNALLVHYSTDYVFDGHGDQALGRDRCDCATQCLRRNQAGRRTADSAIGLQAPYLPHQLGLWRTRRQLRQDHAAACRRTRQPVRHQ